MKKLLSLVLAVGLLVTLAIPVVAASIEENTGRATATKDKAIIIIPGFAGTALKEAASDSIAWYSPGSTGLTACTEPSSLPRSNCRRISCMIIKILTSNAV